MISVNALEYRMSSVIRTGLRKAMSKVDVRDLTASLRHAEDRLTDTLYESLYAQILKTYSEGYIAGGDMIRRHAPRGFLSTAAAPVPLEDPRIALATQSVIYGLKDSLDNHKNEIQAALRYGYEQGYSIPKLTKQVGLYFDTNRAASTRFARTVTNDVYNRAHLDRYEDSGVVDGVQYSAHIDDRTSDICRMLNGTIWRLGDRGIQVPPSHWNCRSRLIPYFGKIPGKRDFTGQFGSDFVKSAEKTSSVFRKKYWSPMPHSKASAPYQRSYFTKSDIKTINKGLNQVIKEERKARAVPNIVQMERLKKMLRYRRLDPVQSTIADRYGKSLLLNKFEERDIIRAMKSLIAQADSRIAREVAKRKREIAAAWKEVLGARKSIVETKKDIVYYKNRMAADPARAVEYQKFIDRDMKRITVLKTSEERRVQDWNRIVDLKPSAQTEIVEREKERYQYVLDGFKFQKR